MAGDTDVLRIFFVAAEGEDATLIVNDPNENWLCNDDFSDWDPMVEIANAPAGQYDIWVGSHSIEGYILGSLYVTETEYDPSDFPGGAPSSSEGGGLDIALDPAYGTAELSAGFQPDPHTVELVSGGPVDVFAAIGADCGGYAAEAPDYRVNLAQDFGRLRIFFVAAGEADATLIVNAPDGNWYCNDDFSGWDPLVEFEDAPAGQYDVWVGSFSADEFINGALYVTEMDYDPDNLP
jgi:serine protease Do